MTAVHPELPSADDGELATEILARRRRRTPRLTLALVVLVAAAAAFVGGAAAQKHWGASPSSSSSSGSSGGAAKALAAFARARAGGTGGFARAFAGGAGGFAGATVGTVTLIKGSTLYVTDATGNTVLVHTTPRSTVTKTVSGTVKTVVPGDTVTVLGTPATNGSTTATSIQIGGTRG